MFWILFLIPLTSFAEQKWSFLSSEGGTNTPCYEQWTKEISFGTKIPVHVEYSYPIFSGKGTLIEYVNRELETEAEDRFNNFVKEELYAEEVEEDEISVVCSFSPRYQTSNLISIGGFTSQIRGSRGCTYYEGKTFWQRGDVVVKLILDDLFVKGSGYRQFLLDYYKNNFNRCDYENYVSHGELFSELSPKDFDAFVLTEKGLMIVFPVYTIGGWAEGPDTVLIPYAKINKFIDFSGPLKEVVS